MKQKKSKHWAEEKEQVTSNRPILFLIWLLSKLPNAVVSILIYPVSFFYLIFSKRGRIETRRYQKKLHKFTDGKVPKKISSYKQILSFSLCVLEKLSVWLGKNSRDDLIMHDDDGVQLKSLLDENKGAVVIMSHLGNMELIRGIASEEKKFSINVLMEESSTSVFNETLRQVNPDVSLNVIDTDDITPETICFLQDEIEKGGIVVVAGDRTSKNTRNRILRKNFLGQEASFPYGAYLLVSLLNAPTFFIFTLRTKTAMLKPKYNMFVEKSEVDFNCGRAERENRINLLCEEYISKLQKYVFQFPYQWYNFFDFWADTSEQ